VWWCILIISAILEAGWRIVSLRLAWAKVAAKHILKNKIETKGLKYSSSGGALVQHVQDPGFIL
jgi:hypothetical protein